MNHFPKLLNVVRKTLFTSLANVTLCPSTNRRNSMGTNASFQFRNEQFSARSRKTRGCAEAYRGTSHKQSRSLTPRLRKRAIYGWKLPYFNNSITPTVSQGTYVISSTTEAMIKRKGRASRETLVSGLSKRKEAKNRFMPTGGVR